MRDPELDSFFIELLSEPVDENDLWGEKAKNSLRGWYMSRERTPSSDDQALFEGTDLIRMRLHLIHTTRDLIQWYVEERKKRQHQPESLHIIEEAFKDVLGTKCEKLLERLPTSKQQYFHKQSSCDDPFAYVFSGTREKINSMLTDTNS